jgi:uncharacterized protein (DUF1499 family)
MNRQVMTFIVLFAATVAVLTFPAAVLLYRLDLASIGPALTLLRYGVMLSGVTFVLGLILLVLAQRFGDPRGIRRAAITLGLSLALLVPMSWQFAQVSQHPYIHDISTDTETPPVYVDLLEARKAAPNGADWAGAELAVTQRESYPTIQPLDLPSVLPTDAWDKAMDVAKSFNWEIAGGSAQDGRIEATETSFWFAFKDDVVIRITPRFEKGSRVDMRSASRVGKSDLGKNAARIQAFLDALRARASTN